MQNNTLVPLGTQVRLDPWKLDAEIATVIRTPEDSPTGKVRLQDSTDYTWWHNKRHLRFADERLQAAYHMSLAAQYAASKEFDDYQQPADAQGWAIGAQVQYGYACYDRAEQAKLTRQTIRRFS